MLKKTEPELSEIVCVSDVERSRRFYEEGLALKRRVVDGDELVRVCGASGKWELVLLTWTQAKKMFPKLIPAEVPATPCVGRFLTIVVEDANIRYVKALAHGGLAVRDPELSPNGEREAVLRDPDGYLVRIASRG